MRLILRMFGQPMIGPARAVLLRRALALFGLALIAATWRLWTPQDVFPQVPLVGIATRMPAWFDWVGAAGMIAGLVLALVVPGTGRWPGAGLLLFVGSTAAMVLADQLRLQAWAYQFMLVALVLALADRPQAFALLRLFIVSFYFHSALTKFDYSFVHALGQQFVSTLAGLLGGTLDGWSDTARLAAAAVFPIAEMAVALGLCFGRTRPAALAGAIALHVLLLVILGPWGLAHKPAVLLWNGYFIVQDVLLFARTVPGAVDGVQPADRRDAKALGWRVAQVLVGAAVLLPLLSPTGWFDTWPSWGLYAPSAERVVLRVHRRELDPMPSELRAYVDEPADPADPWLRVRLDRWAIETLGAPLYPQSRYQLGVAEAVIVRYAPGHRARVIRFALADRSTGRRQHDLLSSMPQLQAAGDEYFLNTRPRWHTWQADRDAL